jgi:hypothetical protein
MLFQEGRSLMKDGKYEQACPKFADSMRLDPSSGTQINLGQCYEAQGRTASAWAEYRGAATLAHNLKRAEHEEKALALVGRIEPKLSKLRVDVTGDVPGLIVKRDGVEIAKSSLGAPVATDPGDHTITASAPGYIEYTAKISLGKEADSQSLTIPALEKSAAPPPSAAAPVEPTETGGSRATSSAPSHASNGGGAASTIRIAGLVVGGVGVVGIGLGAAFGALAAKDSSDAQNDATLCPNKVCKPAGRDVIDSAKTKALVSTLGIGIGAAALAASVVLLVTAKTASTQTGSIAVTARAGTSGGSGFITARF